MNTNDKVQIEITDDESDEIEQSIITDDESIITDDQSDQKDETLECAPACFDINDEMVEQDDEDDENDEEDNEEDDNENDEEEDDDDDENGIVFKDEKNVRFNDKISIHIIDNDDESRNGRIWIQQAMDRDRFKKRIDKFEITFKTIKKDFKTIKKEFKF